jgi:hypothetical protein
MRNVLIASCSFSELCRNITGTLRPLVGGGHVSYYYGDQLERLHVRHGFDLSEVAFLILRLSPHSHQKESAAYATEMGLVTEAHRRRIPVGIICDASGKITAPYITGDLQNHVSLVVSNGPNEGCSPQDVYPQAGTFDMSRPGENVPSIVEYIARQLPAQPAVAPQPQVTRQPQMAATNSGWSDANMTD